MNTCKLCSSHNAKLLFHSSNVHGRHLVDDKEQFDIYQCSVCHCIFQGNIEINGEYYRKYYEGIDDYYLTDNKKATITQTLLECLYRFSRNTKEDYILKYFGSQRGKLNILDVGCGAGDFLESLDENKFNKCGLEIDERGYDLCKKKGLEVYREEITHIHFKEKKFHVITLWHVLEHLTNPLEVLEKIFHILAKDGILILATPNTDSFGFKVGRNRWFHLDAPRHLMLYNHKSLNYLCKKTGFDLIGIKNEFYDCPFDLFWSVRNHPLKYLIYPLYPIFKFFSKEHLTFILKKNEKTKYSS